MQYKILGKSGLKVPVFSLGTGTFGGTNDFFKKWGQTDVKEATRLIDLSLDYGVNFFDTANVYSQGAAEEILGAAVKGRRNQLILSTKGGFNMGNGFNEKGASRLHLIRAVEDSLRRLGTDYIDLYFIHGFDQETPLEESLSTLDNIIKSGKIRYIGCSNFAAWQLMKALSISEKKDFEKFIVYQGYYSLIGRDAEQELLPLLKEENVGFMAWSPLGWGRLTGKLKRNQPVAEGRVQSGGLTGAPPVHEDYLFNVIDELEIIAEEIGKPIPQIALNWLLQKEAVASIVIGARNEKQLIENLKATNWILSAEQLDRLDQVSYLHPIYPHWVGER